MATGIGLAFTVVGFLLVTDYRGGRRWILNKAEASLDDVPEIRDPLRRLNVNLFHGGDPERHARFKSHVMPHILGWPFMVMGGFTLLVGLLMGIVLLIHAL